MRLAPTLVPVALLAVVPRAARSDYTTPGAVASDSAAEMARKLQDPLANIKAVMTDNDILFRTGDDDTSYSFGIQPLKAWSFEDAGFNLVARGIVPVLGLAPQAQKPIVGEPLPAGSGTTWGLGDVSTQLFFSPKTDNALKWGVGPVLSFPTATDRDLEGPGWGAGPVGVLVGSAGNVSYAFVGGHLWGENEGYSTTFLQPMVFYNLPGMAGSSLSYNFIVSYDWNAESGNEWTVPLGVLYSKVFARPSGLGIEVMAGPFWNVAKPEGAADGGIKWAVNFLLP